MHLALVVAGAGLCQLAPADEALPLLVVRSDDTQIERSCRVEVPAGLVLEDVAGDGLLQVVADGVRIVFLPGSVLAGAPEATPLDRLTGTGIAVHGRRDVQLVGAAIAGCAIGVHASQADGLQLLEVSVLSARAQRLRSSATAADDGADWLLPHHNDQGEWRTLYGAGFCIERSRAVTVRGCRVRRAQNGLLLDRVEASRVAGNDFSFLSGWGLALWRSSGNELRANALDFCVRGYSHGVYNRGQDSAGLLLFEQCHDNLVAGNSITHGGDGIFAFAGQEVLDGGLEGHHGNRFLGNDLSFAAAHGLELTFAGSNLVAGNLFEGNAICGLWGGYSAGLLVAGNRFVANGEAGYGQEHGGVNIEHGRDLRLLDNEFQRNSCGIHLWWDADEALAATPWARARSVACSGNLIAGNGFEGDRLALHLADCMATVLLDNRFVDVGRELRLEGPAPETTLTDERSAAADPRGSTDGRIRLAEALAEAHAALLARPALSVPRGRPSIRMTPWGPWDHEAPAWSLVSTGAAGSEHALLGATATQRATLAALDPQAAGPGVELLVLRAAGGESGVRLQPAVGAEGLLPWSLRLPGLPPLDGTLLACRWDVSVFASPCDPRTDELRWRAQAGSEAAVRVSLPALDLRFGGGGPSDLGLHEDLDAAGLPRDHFGLLARAELPLPAGRWRLVTLSDDGLRLHLDGEPVIDDWTWHGPTTHEHVLELESARTLALELAYFELDGHAVLQLQVLPDD